MPHLQIAYRMKIVSELDELRSVLADKRKSGPIAFVPTMGNLHLGHLSLVREAKKLAGHVVVSIFVNPMQFGAGEDLDNYPRTFDRDCESLEGEGTELLFAPNVQTIYARPQDEHTRVEVPHLSGLFCGRSRPTHFIGVSTVVCKLFNMVQPDVAVFGKKDYQQLMIIRRMTEDMNIPVRVIGAPTVREDDGLAMSSRNGYLTAEERKIAPFLYRTLCDVANTLQQGHRNFTQIEQNAAAMLDAEGLRTDYISIRRMQDLAKPSTEQDTFVVLAAAYLGRARLIDNIEVL